LDRTTLGYHSLSSNRECRNNEREQLDWIAALIKIFYPEGVIGTITTAFGAKNYSNHQELMEGSVVVYEVALPIQDGRGLEKKQNGLGLGEVGDPSYTLDSVGGQSVATWWDGGQISQTLDAVLAKGQTMPDKNRFPAVIQESRVRRLTPRECERLQGFPDDWTDNGSDSARYKQMGNAVTVNVISWIGSRL
jgi:site-specific DNA-cytosine methylase